MTAATIATAKPSRFPVRRVETVVHLAPQVLHVHAKSADIPVEPGKAVVDIPGEVVEALVAPLLSRRHHRHDPSVTF
jgi:hypothetical protein